MDISNKKILNGMLILFVAPLVGIVATPLSAVLSQWVALATTILSLVGTWMLYRGVISRKLCVAAVASIITFVIEVLLQIVRIPSGAELLHLAVTIMTNLVSMIYLYFLFRGTADYMVEHGYPETAKDGKIAANLAIAVTILGIVVELLGTDIWLERVWYLKMIVGASGSMIALVAIGMGIVLAIIRLTFFYQCRKKLLAGQPEAPSSEL